MSGTDTDVAIVGSGFGGSVMAMIARRLGLRVTLLERGRHPRFAIGESASPLAGILIEQLADRYDLPRLRPLSAFGTWQRAYPHVACGLKRGFTYFRHERGEPYRVAPDRSNQLLVAASPNDELSDTHWLRSDVDHFLVNEATALGVDYQDLVELEAVEWQPDGSPRLVGARRGTRARIAAHFIVDASGPGGFLSRALGIANHGFDGYPATQALFSHFTDVARCDELPDFTEHDAAQRSAVRLGPSDPRTGPSDPRPGPSDPRPGPSDSRTGRSDSRTGPPDLPTGPPHLRDWTLAPSHPRTFARCDLPYPMDDAALHHVFDGGWMWVLRFGNGVTSAGVAVEDWLAEDLKLAEGEPAWLRLLARFPSVAAQFGDARPIRPFTWMPRLACRAASAAGERWAMLPSAAAFIDPLFSTGIPLTLLGIERLAGLLEGEPRGLKPALYADAILSDADRTARFIAGSYAGFRRFPVFAAYSMFYFAAASFSEMARRSASPRTPRGFLCGDSDAFGAALERLSPAAGNVDVASYEREVAAAVADWNVAGLCDPEKRNWYPVDPDDAIRNADKLGLTRKQVRERLALVACSS